MKQCHTKGREKSPEAVRDYPSPRVGVRASISCRERRAWRVPSNVQRSTSNVRRPTSDVQLSRFRRRRRVFVHWTFDVGRWMLKPQRPDHCATKAGRALLSWGSLAGRSLRLQPARGVANQLRSTFYIQFVLDMAAVRVNGFDAQVELFGDAATVLALADQAQNFEFPVGEPGDRGTGPGAAIGEGIHDAV